MWVLPWTVHSAQVRAPACTVQTEKIKLHPKKRISVHGTAGRYHSLQAPTVAGALLGADKLVQPVMLPEINQQEQSQHCPYEMAEGYYFHAEDIGGKVRGERGEEEGSNIKRNLLKATQGREVNPVLLRLRLMPQPVDSSVPRFLLLLCL